MRKIGETDAIFYKEYGDLKRRHYFAHGRIEILGNHTDHNHGLALVGGSSLGITCACCPNDLGLVRLASFGFRPFEIHLDALEAKEEEKEVFITWRTAEIFPKAVTPQTAKLGKF